ncbi:MAG: amylo-alpha-1,6-glucosidase [Amaricoccus sp.]
MISAKPGEPGVRPAQAFAQFFVPVAASLQERRPQTLKHGDTFAVFDHNGDAVGGPGSPEGIYHRDTRHLSHFYLTVEDLRPLLLSSTVRDDNAVLICDLTNPEFVDGEGRRRLAQDLLHLRRTRFLWNARAFDRLALTSYDTTPRLLRFRLDFAADFADIFEVRGAERARRGQSHPPLIEPDAVTLAYTGLDDRRRETRLQFEPSPTHLADDSATFEVELAPNERKAFFLEIRCGHGYGVRAPRRAFFAGFRDARRALRGAASRAASISSSNEVFNETVRRSVSDLYMLTTETSRGPYPYAGIPWFSTFFGRDALITALQTLWLDPSIAAGVLRNLADRQATEVDAEADAEPGKILHEMRFGEMAELKEVPFGCYFGSVDSTPLFVILAGAYLDRTGDVETTLELWPHIEAALGWLGSWGDRDGDGFVEYGRQNADGLINQGWKDSHDSIFHADGTLATGPVALVEVQAYAYGAWRAGAAIARRLRRRDDEVAALVRRATDLRSRFDQAFWDEELGTYVIALDGEKRPCRVRTSNAGHALLTGIARPSRAARVVESLMAPSFFSGWGIRTLASTEPRYNPMSYHNGSVWPHDNALIAAGMARYGFRAAAAAVFRGLYDASTYIDLKRLPELFCGFPRVRSVGPTFYPVACSPQAWSAGAPLSLVRSCLGIKFDPENRYVIFDQPVLPDFVDDMALRQLSLGDGGIDVRLARANAQVAVNVVARRGGVRAIIRS